MKIISLSFSLFILIGCNSHSDNINDKSKRNANWEWWVDASTGKGEWVPITKDSSTVKNGRYTNFYFNGEKCEEGKLVNGKNADTLFAYDLKGQLDFYEIFRKDTPIYIIQDGYRKMYYRKGSLLAESNIKNHTYDGVLINYYENGNRRFARNYVKDSGWNINYYENGQMKDSSIEFNNTGKGRICKTWFENGQVDRIIEWNMKTGVQEGTTKRFYENSGGVQSILRASEVWKNGLWDGVTLLYYPNGQLNDSMFFIQGKREGIAKAWYENGQLKLINIYKKDSLLSSKNFTKNAQIQ